MLSVGRILEGAFGLVRERFVAVAVWIGIYMACNIAFMLTLMPMMGAAMNPAAASDPGAMLAAMLPMFAMIPVFLLIATVLYAAAMRAVLRPDAGGLAFLRLGMDELRLIGLCIIFAIVGMVLMFGISMAFGLVSVGIMASTEAGMGSVLMSFLLMIAVFAIFIFFIVRFSLAFPLTLYRGKIVIGEAWTLSRGRFWSLFGATFVITLILVILNIAVSVFTMGSYFFDLMGAAGNPEAVALAAEAQAQSYAQFSPVMILSSLGTAIVAGLGVALTGGSVATAAKLLLQDEMDDAEDVFG
ncbi:MULTISPECIES: hypothetical protein [unclassified Sphingomonas]|uniref:hypothetical protein n=1 Tax=unclassified Sphingomonas TaxID=196159 RepID=UPI0021517C8C|nr:MULTISPECIES: hypothetical protein [unclassified Sphingomonas]MCR5870289.1 hypothetical protein [Sphingomonas sp. J344]UUX98025.1 hypothetical protein LRS08_10310 [Sphingomonas sp. J315]